MFCNKCGNEIKEGEKFCAKCGNKVRNEKRKKMAIIIGIILLAILICAIFYIKITVNNMNNDTNKQIKSNNISSNVENLKVGDFVNYIPQKTLNSYTFLGEYTGELWNNTTVYQENLQWRILNINENGTVDLISSTPTESVITFRGALGYNNGVYLLNDFCNKIYGNSTIGATARSLNIEDIQDKMDLAIWDYHNYIYESSTKNVKYGETYTLTNKSQIYYPYQWKLDKGENKKVDNMVVNGTMSESEQYELTTEDDYSANSSIDIQQTFWERDRAEMKNTYKKGKTRNSISDNNIYYELFYADARYWLSSRGVHSKNYTFGIRCMFQGIVALAGLENASSPPGDVISKIRPVVNIPISLFDLSSDYDEIGVWNLQY